MCKARVLSNNQARSKIRSVRGGLMNELSMQQTQESFVFLMAVTFLATPVFAFQAGVFASTAEYGAERTIINGPFNFFGTFYLGDSFKPENRVPGAAGLYTGGVTLGKQFLFNASATNYDGTLFYARIGTGVGFAGVSGNTTRGSNMYYGLNTTAIAGAMKGISGHGSLYVEMGTRAIWFLTFEERGVLGAPHLSIGFMFSGTRDIIPVRF